MNKFTIYYVLILLVLVLFSGVINEITGLAVLPKCKDQDNGANEIFTKTCISKVGTGTGTWCDKCADAQTVSEVRCKSKYQRKRSTIACPTGYSCRDGACIGEEQEDYLLSEYCMVLRYNGNLDNSANIVFVSSGFKGLESSTIKPGFREKVHTVWETLNNYPPFSVKALNAFYVTKINTEGYCQLGCNGIDRLLCCDYFTALNLANHCLNTSTILPTNNKIVVLHNSADYGGSGGFLATSTIHEKAPKIVAHELGHSFFGLGDEYDYAFYSNPISSPNCDHQYCNKWKDIIGFSGVNCIFGGCSGGEFYVSENTIMKALIYNFEEVNERISCCEYYHLIGNYPSDLCNKFIGIGLNSFCDLYLDEKYTTDVPAKYMFKSQPYEYVFVKKEGEWVLMKEGYLKPGYYNSEMINGQKFGKIIVNISSPDLGAKQLLFSDKESIEYFDENKPLGYKALDRSILIIITDGVQADYSKGSKVAQQTKISIDGKEIV